MTTLYVDNIAPNLQSKISAPNLQLPSGSVVQVVNSSTLGSSASYSLTSFTDTGVSVAITPTSASSKIFVIVNQIVALQSGTAHTRCDFRCIEAGTSTELYRMDFYGRDGTGTQLQKNCAGSGIFQCTSTDTLTFKTQVQKAGGADTEAALIFPLWYADAKHNITAMEIAG